MISQQIRKKILKDIGGSTGSERKSLAKLIHDNQVPITELLDILFLEHPISTRFSWLLSDVCELDPNLPPVILKHIFPEHRKISVLNFDRVLAKQAYLCGENIPEALEGEITDWLFKQLANPSLAPSIKHYVVKALRNLIIKYPDLQIEFDLIQNQQQNF